MENVESISLHFALESYFVQSSHERGGSNIKAKDYDTLNSTSLVVTHLSPMHIKLFTFTFTIHSTHITLFNF